MSAHILLENGKVGDAETWSEGGRDTKAAGVAEGEQWTCPLGCLRLSTARQDDLYLGLRQLRLPGLTPEGDLTGPSGGSADGGRGGAGDQALVRRMGSAASSYCGDIVSFSGTQFSHL